MGGAVSGGASVQLVEDILVTRHCGDSEKREAVRLVVASYASSASRRSQGTSFALNSAAFYEREARTTMDGDGDSLLARARAERRIASAIEGLAS